MVPPQVGHLHNLAVVIEVVGRQEDTSAATVVEELVLRDVVGQSGFWEEDKVGEREDTYSRQKGKGGREDASPVEMRRLLDKLFGSD